MDTVINDFVHTLRRHGVRVSPAESLDALYALEQVGLGERGEVRDALRSTLIKSTEDIETFDRLFELYFGLHPTEEREAAGFRHGHDHDHGGTPTNLELGEDAESEAPDDEGHSHDDEESTEMRRFFDEDRMQQSENIHDEPDRMRLSLFSQELLLNRKPGALDQAMRRITHQLRMRRAKNMFNPGGIAPPSDAEELPIDVSATDLQEMVDHLHDLEVDEDLIQALTAQTEDILKGLPQLIEAMKERQQKLETKETASLEKRSLRRILDFSPGEQREMEAAVRRLARQIHGARTRRLKKDRAGHISVAHTLRHNLRYEGVPFQPVLRRRHEKRPRLVVLCDVSLSTRNLARFWLHLVHQLQDLFSKVRTFVFVADTAEATQLFEEQTFERAVEDIFESRLIDVDVNSDFGRAAEQFVDEHLSTINRRTTVVILGDGRNNGKPPNVEALEEITHHARQTIWMTPEPRWGWQLGGCDMPLYEPLCNRVEVVRNVEQLAGVAEELVKNQM